MINNFEGSYGGHDDDENEFAPEAFDNINGAFLANHLQEPEKSFVQTKPNEEGQALLSSTPQEVSSWFFKSQEAGRIPSDWPTPACLLNPGKPMKATDWPTFVLFASLMHSGPELSMMPPSYESVKHRVWQTNSGVVLVWDGSLQMAQIATGKNKEQALERMHMCVEGVLDLLKSEGILPSMVATLKSFYNAVAAVDEDVLEQACAKAADESGMGPELFQTNMAAALLLWSKLMVRQTPGFHLHRCVVIGDVDGKAQTHLRAVLCSYEECGEKQLHKVTASSMCEEEIKGFAARFVIDESDDDVFQHYENAPDWLIIDADEWILSPDALKAMQEAAELATPAI